MGDVLYFIDYESRRIVILGADELEGMAGDYTPLQTPFPFPAAVLPTEAKGQALIILGDKLYALYIVTGQQALEHDPGVLCRLNIHSNGALTYDNAQVTVGLNPQAIIPVTDEEGAVQLLIPAIGGYQKDDGTTNGTYSNITCVPALGDWDHYVEEGTPVLLTGDPAPSSGGGSGEESGSSKDTESDPATPTAYDIHAVAAGMRGPSNMLYILTQIYNDLPAPSTPETREDEDATEKAFWKLYRITVGDFLNLKPVSGDPPTLTQAEYQGLEAIDEGEVYSIVPGGIYFWDLLYAQTDEVSDAGDLLWAALGTPILVTRAAEEGYGAPDSAHENAYVMFGFNGGNNVNAIDMTIEVINQAKRGGVSLKRGLYGHTVSGSA